MQSGSAGEKNLDLVEVAHQLLMTIPIDEVDVERVAERAGVSTDTVFDHFGTSREIRLAALRVTANDLIETLLLSIQRAVERSKSEDMRLAQSNRLLLCSTVATYLDHVMGYPSTYATLNKLASVDPEFGAIFKGVRAQATSMILDCFRLNKTPVTNLLVVSWIQFVEAVMLNWLDNPADVSREELLEVLISGTDVYFAYFETREGPVELPPEFFT